MLERIATVLESIDKNLSSAARPRAEPLLMQAEKEWENRDLEELYAELDERSQGPVSAVEAESHPPSPQDNSWTGQPSHDWEKERFYALTDGMAGHYKDHQPNYGATDPWPMSGMEEI